jgi:hypothetical protein
MEMLNKVGSVTCANYTTILKQQKPLQWRMSAETLLIFNDTLDI